MFTRCHCGPLSFRHGLVILAVLAAGFLPAAAGPGLRFKSVKPVVKPGPLRFAAGSALQEATVPPGVIPPVEGPLIAVPIVVSDQNDGELEFFATVHYTVEGLPLGGGSSFETIIGLLDSGASTHLIGYSDAVRVGLQDAYMTGNTFAAGGAGCFADLEISWPVGVFAHGLQDVDENGNARTERMFGLGNFACGVNTPANEEEGITIPTVLGAPFLLHFPAYIRNSQPTNAVVFGRSFSSPSVTFYDDPEHEDLPSLTHRVFLEMRPTGGTVSYVALFDPQPLTPSVILSGFSAALYFTASDMVFTNGIYTTRGRMLVDTGAQGTVLSEIAAAELDLDLNNPDFEVEVQGLCGTTTRPGFYIDAARLPASGGALVWGRIPVVIANVPHPEGGTMFGVFGSNLIANRDLVFNGASSPPYLDLTGPFISPVVRITETQMLTTNVIQIGWRAEPAPPTLRLEATTDLTANPPQWITVATNEFATVTGTMSVTGLVSRQFFRLVAP